MKTRIHRIAEAGFTMVELIIVIIILGVLAATMLPRYMDVTGQANIAMTNKMHGDLKSTLSSAHGMHLAQMATGTAAAAVTPAQVTTCAILLAPGNYLDDDGGVTCADATTLTFPDGRTAVLTPEILGVSAASATLADLN